MLANAVYLKAPWKQQFEQNETHSAPFHFADGRSADVPTMRRQDAFGYAKHDGFVAIALPYTGGDLQFLVLLPDTAVGLPTLESKLTPDLLAECARLKPEEIVLVPAKVEAGAASLRIEEDLRSARYGKRL